MPTMNRWARNWIFHNIGTKVVSVLIAIVLWIVVLGSRNVETTKEIPIEVVTGEGLVVANDIPDRVAFRLSGPKAFLRVMLDRRDSPIRVDLSSAKSGIVTYRFFSDSIRLPIGVKVLSVTPSTLVVRLEPEDTKQLPVRVALRGAVPSGYHLREALAEPKTVSVRGARSRLAAMDELVTLPVDVNGAREGFETDASFDLGSLGLKLEGALPKVRIAVNAVSANFRIKNLRIRVLTSLRARVTRKSVNVSVRAAMEDLKGLGENDAYAEVDLRGKPAGKYRVPVKVVLPKNISLVEVEPAEVAVSLF